ncbi:MAG: LytTR family DNA-binding domain-containing protein [Acidobacteriaceae bacterium]|nr:LytTR family DNA-binding domain-containing protein [Acidobacteriaceae bacterium]
MTAFRVLVGDDEPLARSMLAELLRRDDEIASVVECSDGTSIQATIAATHPHIAFLDIEMPGIDGLQIANALHADSPVVVFVTAFSDYAPRAFEVHAVDYVLKPFSDRRFKEALERAKQRVRDRRLGQLVAQGVIPQPPVDVTPDVIGHPATGWLERLSLREGNQAVVLKTSDIVWIEAQDYYVMVHSTRGRHLVRTTLASLEARLDPRVFLRVHRAAIVNLDEVRSTNDRGGLHLMLSSGAVIPVSRARRRLVDTAVNPRLRVR